jgi:hypothetical protein
MRDKMTDRPLRDPRVTAYEDGYTAGVEDCREREVVPLTTRVRELEFDVNVPLSELREENQRLAVRVRELESQISNLSHAAHEHADEADKRVRELEAALDALAMQAAVMTPPGGYDEGETWSDRAEALKRAALSAAPQAAHPDGCDCLICDPDPPGLDAQGASGEPRCTCGRDDVEPSAHRHDCPVYRPIPRQRRPIRDLDAGEPRDKGEAARGR